MKKKKKMIRCPGYKGDNRRYCDATECMHRKKHTPNYVCKSKCFTVEGKVYACQPVRVGRPKKSNLSKSFESIRAEIKAELKKKKELKPLATAACGRQPKLRIRFEKWEKALVMQVLHMDERFRRNAFTFTAANGMKVTSFYSMFIAPDEKEIWLRGSRKGDDLMVVWAACEDNAARDAFYDKILVALKDWANNWEGWKEKDPVKAPAPEPGILEF